jgi:hypothetical protein
MGAESAEETSLWAIHRVPDATTVTPGAKVRYSCDWVGGGARPPGTHGDLDSIRWHVFKPGAPDGRSVRNGPVAQTWDIEWPNAPGDYLVLAEIRGTVGPKRGPVYCFLAQKVGATAPFLREGLERILAKGHAPSAWDAEKAIHAFREKLNAIAQRFPPEGAQREEHAAAVDRWRKQAEALRALLQPTDGRRRIPFIAFHLETATQKTRALFLFLTELDPEGRGYKQMGTSQKRWVLVDWTDALDPRFHGAYLGEAGAPDSAIRDALRAWDWENRYPAGRVLYDVPAELTFATGEPRRREMTTNGRNVTEEVIEGLQWIAVGSMLVAGIGFLFVPVATLSSAAMATSLLASTAGAVLSIEHRRHDGIFDWEADAIDALTILGNLVGAGTWARGAQVLALDPAGKTVEYVFIGTRMGTDSLQGILVAHSRAEEMLKLTEDPGYAPEERARLTLGLLGELTALGLMMPLSLKASARSLEHLRAKPVHLMREDVIWPPESTAVFEPRPRTMEPPPSAEIWMKSIEEKLQGVTSKGETLDLRAPPVSEGGPGGQARTTQVSGRGESFVRALAPDETDFAKRYPPDERYWKDHSIESAEITIRDKDDFFFEAYYQTEGPDQGEVTFSVRTVFKEGIPPASERMWAKDLFRLAHRHFAQVGNPVKRVKIRFVNDNFRAAWPKYEALKKAAKAEVEAGRMVSIPIERITEEAIRSTKTYRYHAELGFGRISEPYLSEHGEYIDCYLDP